jgi:hypothetical protein
MDRIICNCTKKGLPMEMVALKETADDIESVILECPLCKTTITVEKE